MDYVHHVPLAAFGGVDGAQDQIIFVQKRRTGQITGRGGRIERQLAKKSTTRRVARGDMLQLLDVLVPRERAAVALHDDWLAEAADARNLSRWRQAGAMDEAIS